MGLKTGKESRKSKGKSVALATICDKDGNITDLLISHEDKMSQRPCYDFYGNNVSHVMVSLNSAKDMIESDNIAYLHCDDAGNIHMEPKYCTDMGLYSLPPIHASSYAFFKKVQRSCVLVPIRLGVANMPSIEGGVPHTTKEVTVDCLVLCRDLKDFLRSIGFYDYKEKDVLQESAKTTRTLLREASQDSMFLYGLTINTFKTILENTDFRVLADPTWIKQCIADSSLRSAVTFGAMTNSRLATENGYKALLSMVVNSAKEVVNNTDSKVKEYKSAQFGPNTQEYLKKFNMTPESFIEDSERLMRLTGTSNLEELEKEIASFI